MASVAREPLIPTCSTAGAVAKLDAMLISDIERSVHEQRLKELKSSEDVRFYWVPFFIRVRVYAPLSRSRELPTPPPPPPHRCRPQYQRLARAFTL